MSYTQIRQRSQQAMGWRASRRVVAGLSLLAAACAAPQLPTPPLPQVAVGGVFIAGEELAPNSLLDSRVTVNGPAGWLRYDAQYRLDGGDLLPQLNDTAAAPLTQAPYWLGGNRFTQSLATSLPAFLGPAPQLTLTSSSGNRWNTLGEQSNDAQQARLAWSPAPVDVQLQWQAPRSVRDPLVPLDCNVGGKLKLDLAPLGIGDQSLFVGARDCNVDAPERAALPIGVESWSGGWQFGRPAVQNKLALSVMETHAIADSPLAGDSGASGYELRLSQTRAKGRWVGDSAVGVRRVIDPLGLDSATAWIAQASLKRRIHNLGVTAGWQRDADPLWFVPGVAQPVDRLAVGVDFKSWLTQSLGLPDLVTASMSYQWNQSDDPALDGGGVFWNLSKAW